MRNLIAAAAFLIASCSGSSSPPVSLEQRLNSNSNTGMVSVCSGSTRDGDFAFQIDTVAMTMRWWSTANNQVVSQSAPIFQIKPGRAGQNGVSVIEHTTYTPESSGSRTMADSGVMSNMYGLSIRNTDPLVVVGNYNPRFHDFDLFICSLEEYSLATVDGVLIN